MAEVEPPGEYSLTLPDGTVLQKSRGYTGQGKAAYTNGDVYEGEFQLGFKHGKGVYTCANGDKFTGNYVDNKRYGLGKLEFASGGFYHGHWLNGKRHGSGTEKYANNDVYSGQWEDNKKHGKGTYAYAGSRAKLIGDWVNGKLIEGEWVWKNGVTYIGKFQNQKPTGEGRWVFPNGTQLGGTFKQTLVPIDEVERSRRKIAKQPNPAVEYQVRWTTKKVGSVENGFPGEESVIPPAQTN